MDKLLRQFLEVAVSKSFSQAARKLGLSQPTLTVNMKRLEESLGVTLLSRSSTGIELTEFGEIVLEQARIMQRVYDNTLQKLELVKERADRGLQIGTGHAWWQPVVKPVCDAYLQRYPSASLNVSFGNHLRLLDLLLNNEIDLFLGHEILGLTHRSGLLFVPLFTANDAVFVRANHPLLSQPCSTKDLLEYPSLQLTPDERRFLDLVDDPQPKKQEHIAFRTNEKIHYKTNSMMAAVDLINSTNAVMPYPRTMADYFQAHNILPLQMTEHYNKGMIGVYLSREKMEDSHVACVLTLIRSQVKDNAALIATF